MLALISVIKLMVIVIWSVLCISTATLAYLLSFQKNVMLFLAKNLWARPMLIFLGSRVVVHGKEKLVKGQHYLIMANHASYGDIPALFRALPFYLHFIAKMELKKVPFLGWYMGMSGMIFIDRQNKVKSKQSIDAAAELIKKGKNVVIYPEGTTSRDGKIHRFKKGGLHLALASQSTILPVRIKGTYKAWPNNSNLKLRGGKIDVFLGDPIPYDTYKNRDLDQFSAELREEVIALGNGH